MKEKGFSVIELSAGIAIIMTISAMAVSPILSAIESYRLSAASSAISATLYRARSEAITRNANRDVFFSLADNSFGIDANDDGALDTSEKMALPRGVYLSLPGGTATPCAIRFNSRGEVPIIAPSFVLTGSPSVQVANSRDAQQVTVSLRGSVSVTAASLTSAH
ncbi:MAG TPA: GspH/FimT family pseudopilin [Blastocatellia bacterium]|nr:GspH/FimT family pseudopilin [Blastocatellia bacterium]